MRKKTNKQPVNFFRSFFSFSRLLIPILLILYSGCRGVKYDIEPDETKEYNALTLKVNVKYKQERQRENFKILMKYDNAQDKMLFLSPVNTIHGILVMDGEEAVLVNNKKKKYWKGPFVELIAELWGIRFDYVDFKNLIVSGVIPQEKTGSQSVEVLVKPGGEGVPPVQIDVDTLDVAVRIKVSDRKIEKGGIRFDPGIAKMKRTYIRDLFQ